LNQTARLGPTDPGIGSPDIPLKVL
jgi:hypothetical protein